MRYWSASHDLLSCGGSTGLFQSSVPCTTNIPFHPWFCFPLQILDLPESRVGVTWCSLALPIYHIISLSCLLTFGLLQLDLGYGHPWDPCWTTSLKWGGYYNYSWPWPSPALMWDPCPPPTHYSWSQYSPWRVSIMRWSRGWISASRFMNRFVRKWRSRSSIPQSAGWTWGYHF